jgi:nitroreductase / dihydropteridine reductase
MGSFLSQLEWRNATKKFDESKKVSDADLGRILGAIRMAPTSFGLQPFYVRMVKDAGLKAKLQAAGWGQAQFPTSTATLVFVARTDVKTRIEEMMVSRSKGDPAERAKLKDGLDAATAKAWAQKQCYIGLGFGLAACAELGIDSCPMEGFAPAEFDAILGLPKGHFSTVVLTVGTAAVDALKFPKWRFPTEDIARGD